jgi:hypothetical protein
MQDPKKKWLPTHSPQLLDSQKETRDHASIHSIDENIAEVNRDSEIFPLLFERKCEICGKPVFPTGEYAWKRRNSNGCMVYYCKYTHYLKGEEPPKKSNRCKPVAMMTMDGEVLKIFSDASTAAALLGYQFEGIRGCCRGNTPHYRGYKWRYVEDQKNA